jgi:2-polyprenyl-6-methoxyphenol hydroxylase-like FAD-dependent oxidoreductase
MLPLEDLTAAPDSLPEVLVVGAGPVGLFTALVLAGQGISVQVIDAERRPAARSYALVLHSATLDMLAPYGFIDEILARCHRVTTLACYEGPERKASLDLNLKERDFPFVAVLGQQTLETLLAGRLAELGVAVGWNRRLLALEDAESLSALIEPVDRRGRDLLVAPRFVVGADGHRSTVRQSWEIPFPEVAKPTTLAVFELTSPFDLGGEARVVLDRGTRAVLWPLGHGRLRWSFEVEGWEGFVEPRFKSRVFAGIGEEPFAYLVREKLDELVGLRAPWFVGNVGQILWSMAVRFEHRLASPFGRGDVWLAGDAAHLACPIAAQSLNRGLQEAHDLAWALYRILRLGASRDLLADYGERARRRWSPLLGVAGPPVSGPSTDTWVRANASQLVGCLPATGADLAALLGSWDLTLKN